MNASCQLYRDAVDDDLLARLSQRPHIFTTLSSLQLVSEVETDELVTKSRHRSRGDCPTVRINAQPVEAAQEFHYLGTEMCG